MADISLDGSAVVITGTDLRLDDAERRHGHSGGYRRALVHDFEDGLTLNWDKDYKGGVTIRGDVRIPDFALIDNASAKRIHAERIELKVSSPLPNIGTVPGAPSHTTVGSQVPLPHSTIPIPPANTINLEQQLRAAFAVIAHLRTRIEQLEARVGH